MSRDHFARSRGALWAKQTFAGYRERRGPIPSLWPGTLGEARQMAKAVPELLDDMEIEWLALLVDRIARSTWMAMVSHRESA